MPTRSDAAYFANADGDELYFIHSGSGTLRTLLGDVSYRAGDYVYVPRSLLASLRARRRRDAALARARAAAAR